MDFGVVAFDGLVGSSSGFSSTASDPETKQKPYGSGLFKKQERSGNNEHESWRSSKLAKTNDDLSASNSKSMSLLRYNGSSLFSADCHQPQNQMLSFSCLKSQAQNTTLPPFQLLSASPYSINTGYDSNNNGVHNGFTPSQWIELEYQAMIYKYISANMPIPSHLLLPIRKAFESVGLSGLPAGLLRPETMGWGGFHLGFSNSTDPEPGRCRRTDGKKWRCSRDAVTDQKYCERHMNRGRHRSRKPVEGQQIPGHSPSAATNTTTSSTTTTTIIGGNASASNSSFAIENLPSSSSINRMFLNKENNASGGKKQDTSSISTLSFTNNVLKPEESLYLISKQQNSFEETSNNEFGLVASDSLLNPSHKKPSSLMYLANQATDESHHPLHQFMDNWSSNQPDRTQMSIASDFLSPTSSNAGKVTTLSPLRLSRESDPIQMGLGVGNVVHDTPMSWESSMGGPLGEALHSSQSSPRGVLQKAVFVSMSNSSAGSSPRADSSRVYEGSSFSVTCSDPPF